MLRTASRLLLGAVFVGGGVLHFVRPSMYLPAMPPALPFPLALILASGVAEVAGGVGLWLPAGAWRRAAGWGLAALLVAVYPANVFMAMAGVTEPAWALWARLPVQGALVAWALRASGALAHSNASNVPGQARRASASADAGSAPAGA